MQVVEALIWAAIRYRSETLNKVATVLGFWLNLLQPLVLLLLCVAFQIQSSVSVRFLIVVGAAYFVFQGVQFAELIKKNMVSRVNDEGHLEWAWSSARTSNAPEFKTRYEYYIAFQVLVIMAFFLFPESQSSMGIVIFGVSYALLFLSYYAFQQNVSEMWCFFANAVPAIMYLY